MAFNPFQVAQPTARFLKVLLFGVSGSGKTRAALTFPGAAVIDAEGGTVLYRGRPGIPSFMVMDAKTVSELELALDFIEADKGKTVKTLVIDPISVFYKVQREATAATNKRKEMGFREWGKLNMRMSSVYTRLTNLPCHVVVIARESTEYEGTGDDMRRVGQKPDADRDITYPFDFIIHMQKDRSGIVVKSRGAELGEGQRLKAVNWDVFAPFANAYAVGKTGTQVDEDSAVQGETVRELHREEFQDRELVEKFVSEWKGQGAQVSDITKALNVSKLSQWVGGVAAANTAMRVYMGLEDAALETDDNAPLDDAPVINETPVDIAS